MMPYLYTIFREAVTVGLPVVRPVFFADPADTSLRSEEDAFLLGAEVLVVPDLAPQRNYQHALPQGIWQPFDFGDGPHPDLPEMRLRGGAIMPTGPVMQYTDEQPLDPLTLVIALDASGQAEGVLYEDDGDGYDFQSGDYLLTTYSANLVGDQLTVSIASEEGTRPRPSRTLNVRLLVEPGYEVTASGTDGVPLTFTVPPAPPTAQPAFVYDGDSVATDHSPASLILTQNNATGFGDNLSELNQMFVRGERYGLRIGITGNLEHNGNGLVLLLDTEPGGQQVLNTGSLSPPPDGIPELDGTRFDNGFEPDHMYHVNAGGGSFWLDHLTLPSGGPIVKTFVGAGSTGGDTGDLREGTNPNGAMVALDNSNAAGVTDSTAATASTAVKGFEMFIPYADLGVADPPSGTVKLAAFVNGNGFISNQWLPGLGGGYGNLGNSPDLTYIPGDQFATVSIDFYGDFDGDGDIDGDDVAAFTDCASGPGVPHDGSPDCQAADLDDDGDVDQSEFGLIQRCMSGENTLADPACVH
jgi:hypothetical protein